MNNDVVDYSGEILFKCELCEYESRRREGLRRHMLHRHSDIRPYSCYVCAKEFSRTDHLKLHFTRHHKDDEYDLQKCKRVTDDAKPQLPSLPPKPASETGAGEPPCKKIKNSAARFKLGKSYGCPSCEYRSYDSWHLKRHMKVHLDPSIDGSTFLCPMKACMFAAETDSLILTHMLKAHAERPSDLPKPPTGVVKTVKPVGKRNSHASVVVSHSPLTPTLPSGLNLGQFSAACGRQVNGDYLSGTHSNSCHSSTPKICDAVFNQSDAANGLSGREQETESLDNIFKYRCSICGLIATSRTELRNPNHSCVNAARAFRALCYHCDKDLSTAKTSALLSHWLSSHSAEVLETDLQQFLSQNTAYYEQSKVHGVQCLLCGWFCISQHLLVKHVTALHAEDTRVQRCLAGKKSRRKMDRLLRLGLVENIELYYCSFCYKTFRTTAGSAKHVTMSHGGKENLRKLVMEKYGDLIPRGRTEPAVLISDDESVVDIADDDPPLLESMAHVVEADSQQRQQAADGDNLDSDHEKDLEISSDDEEATRTYPSLPSSAEESYEEPSPVIPRGFVNLESVADPNLRIQRHILHTVTTHRPSRYACSALMRSSLRKFYR